MNNKYSKEFRESIILRMLPPENARVVDLAQETGIPKDTLYTWKSKYCNRKGAISSSAQPGQKFSSEEKLAIIVETASLNEIELGEYCRRKGLYPEQIDGWKKAFIQSDTKAAGKAEREQLRQRDKDVKKLQSELNRKEKALAETAALLVLEKKLQALWEENEDEKSNSGSAKK